MELHKQLEPRKGERVDSRGAAIRSHAQWRDAANVALHERDSLAERNAAQELTIQAFGDISKRYDSALCTIERLAGERDLARHWLAQLCKALGSCPIGELRATESGRAVVSAYLAAAYHVKESE